MRFVAGIVEGSDAQKEWGEIGDYAAYTGITVAGLSCFFSLKMVRTGNRIKRSVIFISALSNAEGDFHFFKLLDYQLFIAWHNEPAPEQGWTVIYLLDGDVDFPVLEILMRTLARPHCCMTPCPVTPQQLMALPACIMVSPYSLWNMGPDGLPGFLANRSRTTAR
ncbi:MAG: hypothetical protein ACR5LD_06450, partial [Symbiopectobacterium sp.]